MFIWLTAELRRLFNSISDADKSQNPSESAFFVHPLNE